MEDREETPSRNGLLPNPSTSGLVLPPTVKSSEIQAGPTLLNTAVPTALLASSPIQLSPSEVSRPSVLTLPVSTDAGKKDSNKANHTTKVVAPLDELFGSDSLFEASSTSQPPPRQSAKTTQPQASGGVGLKKDKDKSTLPSIFDDSTDDLFQKVKPKPATKKAKASTFLEDDDDDDEEDLFRVNNSSASSSTSSKEIKNSSGFSKQDIFQVLFLLESAFKVSNFILSPF